MSRSGCWKNSAERGEILERDCESFVARMRLVRCTEEGKHGRWLLRGPWSWAEVVTLENGIYVGGDIETVVFHGGYDRAAHPRGRVYWMATRSYSYAKEKAHIGNTAPDEWDVACARGAILWNRRVDQISKEHARELWDLLSDDLSHGEFSARVYELTGECELCGMGMVTAKSVFMATAVLRRLVHFFEAEGFRASAAEWFRRAA